MTQALFSKLEQFGDVSAHVRMLLQNAVLPIREAERDKDLVREGDLSTSCPFILEGFACRYRILRNGQRQITAFHTQNDFCSLSSLYETRLEHSTATLSRVRAVMIPNTLLKSLAGQDAEMGRLLFRAAMSDLPLLSEWVVSLGRRTAQQRTAHLLCEFVTRLQTGRGVDGETFSLPFTQIEMADALGLTPVHVNRTLQWLKGEGLIEVSFRKLIVFDWQGLVRAADFDPAYLRRGHVAALV